MPEKKSYKQDTRPSLIAELIIPLASVGYAIYYIFSIWDFPVQAQVSGRFIAGLLLVLCSFQLVKIVFNFARGGYSIRIGDTFGPLDSTLRRALFFVLILSYIGAVNWGGFTLTTFFFIFFSFLVLGVKPIQKAALISAAASIVGWLFFIVLLGTRFPRGPFENAMMGVFG